MNQENREQNHEKSTCYAYAQYNVNYFGLKAFKDDWED